MACPHLILVSISISPLNQSTRSCRRRCKRVTEMNWGVARHGSQPRTPGNRRRESCRLRLTGLLEIGGVGGCDLVVMTYTAVKQARQARQAQLRENEYFEQECPLITPLSAYPIIDTPYGCLFSSLLSDSLITIASRTSAEITTFDPLAWHSLISGGKLPYQPFWHQGLSEIRPVTVTVIIIAFLATPSRKLTCIHFSFKSTS